MSVRVLLVDGPHHGKILEPETETPGLTIVMPRIPDDGPMVHDLYRWTQEITMGGLWLAMFITGTEAIPAPDPELLKPVPEEPGELDPALVPYLDWPLYFPDDSVGCDKPYCPHLDRDDEGYLASARRLTVREFLADIKAHAEDTGSEQPSDG